MKRCLAGLAFGGTVMALMTVGMARADVPGYTFKSVATLDSTVAGEPIHGDFENGSVNATGVAGFVTELDNGEGAILVRPDGTAQLLKKTGDDAPGGGQFSVYTSNMVRINDAGNILVTLGVDSGDGEIITPLFYDKTANNWTVIATKGMPAPDSGTFEGGNSFSILNNANEVVFTENVTESSAGPAGPMVCLWSKGKISSVARTGAKTARGTLVYAYRPQISDNGIVTFEGKIEGDENYGAYLVKDGVITELASEKMTIPGSTDKFGELRGPVANSNGDVAMMAVLGDSHGIFLYRAKDKQLVPVALPGQDMPGGGKLAGAAYDYRNAVRLSEDGSVFFSGVLDDGGTGVYSWKDGNFALVVRTGQEMKGVGIAKNVGTNIGVSGGLGLSTNGLLTFIAETADATHLVLATPAAPAPAAGQ